jgi:hypothetical protein
MLNHLLNYDLSKVNIVSDAACSGGAPREDAFHYFFTCPILYWNKTYYDEQFKLGTDKRSESTNLWVRWFNIVIWLYLSNGFFEFSYVFFLKKYSDSQCCWKNILILGEGKKKSDSEFLSYNLMLNSEKKILNETKNHNTPAIFNLYKWYWREAPLSQ